MIVLRFKGFCSARFPLPLGAWDGLRYFIVALPEHSINYFLLGITNNSISSLFHKWDYNKYRSIFEHSWPV